MDVNVTVRHFELNDSVKQFAIDSVNEAFGEFRLKISSVSLTLDMQRNMVKAAISVAVKDYPVNAVSEAYDNVYKALEEVITKATAQTRKYLDKKQDHKKACGLKETEKQCAEAETEA